MATQSKWVRPVVDSVVLPAHAQTSTAILYKIGDTGPCGGLVFYVTNGGVNGLEVAPEQGAAAWGCDGTTTNATDTAIGTGAANTNTILRTSCGASTPAAAQLASNYAGGGCSGWYLPSADELALLIQQKAAVGGLAHLNYWSSSEVDANNAWYLRAGGSRSSGSKVAGFAVRAVRDL